ncbi:MAG: glycosyl hydrolase family 8 [Candidatus Omnitrophica bacterium]|nr:glycosyl hydrolase family 8 [Candidatus Omnitrophota bacterium]
MDKLRRILSLMIILILLITIILVAKRFFIRGPSEVLVKSYGGYKRFFLHYDRIVRKEDGAVTSDAQALAMLRAVWMNDKNTFNRLFAWTDHNLSRARLRRGVNDQMNAYRWRHGEIDDMDPNLSADLDYALALILAHRRWGKTQGSPGVGLQKFGKKANGILKDILTLFAFQTLDGRWYLSAEVLDSQQKYEKYPLNTSVFSPAHFKIFYEHTGNDRWLDLVETSYHVLSEISKPSKTYASVGLFPDWCAVGASGKLYVWEARSFDSGWESVRIPYRLALDYHWFGSVEAADILKGFAQFARLHWRDKGLIYCEYTIDGRVKSEYEDAVFYGAYYYAFKILGLPEEDDLFEVLRSRLKRFDDYWIWEDDFAYITNGYVWMTEDKNFALIRPEF